MWGKKKDGQAYPKDASKKGISGQSSNTKPVSDIHLKEKPKMTLEEYQKLTKEDREKIQKEIAEQNKKEIKNLMEGLDEDWLIAALVEGSLGYYSPYMAKLALDRMLKEGSNYSERNMSVYHGDPVKELESDIARFKWLTQNSPAEAQALIAYVKQTKTDGDFARNAEFSSMYPTKSMP